MKRQEIIRRVADTVLQNNINIVVGGNIITISQPTIRTLIKASRYISTLPDFDIHKDDNVVDTVLAKAKDCECLGKLAAILMSGSTKENERSWKIKRVKILGMTIKYFCLVNSVDYTAEVIMNNFSPKDFSELTTKLLSECETGFFLGSIIFLQGINLLQTTKTETTASGQ